MSLATHPKHRSHRLTVVVATCGFILVLAFLAASDTRLNSLGIVLPTFATGIPLAAIPPQPVHQCCTWTPYMLSDEAQRWILDSSRLEVPTLVGQVRKHLSLSLALGALEQQVPGDFVEAGTWRGGMSALLLKALNDYDVNATRQLWAADSFQGLPDSVAQDNGRGKKGEFLASRPDFEDVIKNFTTEWQLTQVPRRLQVLEGWFNDTLPVAPIKSIAYLRLDGDIYTSTRDSLAALYDKVSPGGLIYLDDYGSYDGCKKAVDEFRSQQTETLCPLMRAALPEQSLSVPGKDASWEAVWWVKANC